MDLLAGHARYLTQDTEEVLARIAAVFALVRQPLIERLRKHRTFLARNIEADPVHVFALYGVPTPHCAGQVVAVRDAAMARLDSLLTSLEARDPAAVSQFLRGLGEEIREGIELCAQLRDQDAHQISETQARTALAAYTAFLLQRYFLEILQRSLDACAPRRPRLPHGATLQD